MLVKLLRGSQLPEGQRAHRVTELVWQKLQVNAKLSSCSSCVQVIRGRTITLLRHHGRSATDCKLLAPVLARSLHLSNTNKLPNVQASAAGAMRWTLPVSIREGHWERLGLWRT